MNKTSNIIWGSILVILGVIIGLNALDITNIDIFFKGWWTLIIIIPSFIGLITESEKTWSLIGLLVGIILLLGVNDIISFELISKLILPLILIIVGISLIFKDVISSKVKEEIKKAKRSNNIYSSSFGSKKMIIEDKFIGCEVNAVFGEYILDLTKAEINDNCLIKTSAVFGEVKIKVPENVRVQAISTSILGSTDNNKKKGDNPVIYVQAFNLFGGTDIKWKIKQ